MVGVIGRCVGRANGVRAGILFVLLLWGVPSSAQDAPDISKAAGDLTKAIEAFAKAVTVDQASKVAADKQKELLDAIDGASEKLTPYERVDQLSAFAKETKRLKDTFDGLTKDQKKIDMLKALSRIDARAKDKATQIAAIDANKGQQLFDTIEYLRAILTALGPSRRINIVGAWFGDAEAIKAGQPANAWRGGPRFCSATAAVQTFCEARSACFTVKVEGGSEGGQSLTGTAGDVAPDKLCGYNPVPYAADDTKALIVVYNCLSISDEAWKAQDEIVWHKIDWASPPHPAVKKLPAAKGTLADPSARDSTTEKADSPVGLYGAVLRTNAIGEIRCYRGDLSQ